MDKPPIKESNAGVIKVLTFNHHESYLVSLAATGHDFDVVVEKGSLKLHWNASARDVPDNFRLVKFNQDVRGKLRDKSYDVVICHTVKNLLWLFFYPRQNCIFVAHIPLFWDSLSSWLKSTTKKLLLKTFSLKHNLTFLAVSEFKQNSWGLSGHTVVLTPENVPPLSPPGDRPVLVICNQLASRKDELGLELIEEVAKHFPLMVVGNNPGIPYSITPKDYRDFCRIISQARIYLFTIKQPFGDGYNTAMLEAMKMGLAVVSVVNPSSPIRHKHNGLIGDNARDLIEHLRYLLEDPEEVERLGKAAKETITQQFSKSLFVDSWNRVLQDAIP